jgi:hypothetical protein
MWQAIPRGSGYGLSWVGVVLAALLASSTHASADDGPECTVGQERKILQGLRSTPVPLDLSQTDPHLVGLGSYLVNAQGGCNDCHTNPPHVEGGNPFLRQPPVVNADGYLAAAWRLALSSPAISPPARMASRPD